ncbi:MAG TPA: type II toxin-antitoxin system VapC family toxin [Propionibacteriaceae bacterium]|nr:type II toxin-antitoxin system VapC family toxin [Propionibacteriaceae bacterium]
MTAYLLDTNVISEPTRSRPTPAVLARLQAAIDRCAVAAITWHELRFGIERLPDGRRKESLTDYLRLLAPQVPILPYDQRAADWHARMRAREAGSGATRPFADGQIAAIAAVHGLTLVTRNLPDFVGIDGLLVESWHGSPGVRG